MGPSPGASGSSGEGDWRGTLFINETGPDRRSMLIRAELVQ
jgi:hypothetical protein